MPIHATILEYIKAARARFRGEQERMKMQRVLMLACTLAMVAGGAMAQQIPGWEAGWPAPQKVFDGCDPQTLQLFNQQSAALRRNPRDEEALVNRGVYGLRLARKSRYETFLVWLAAKDLEQAIKIDPNDFAAWHNYGDVNYSAGDMWAINDHSNARRSVDAFSHAIALNPRSARSYMGRGWAYYQMFDGAHATADFRKALELDPSLRADLDKEVKNIDGRHRQEVAARGTINQMSSYFVERSAQNEQQCAKYVCYWTQGECRCSNALNPGH
jgi:tetratricopeptide (TPR) repeat protein